MFVCKFWPGFRLLLVPLGVHQPLHEILCTPGVQILAVVAGECALGMAFVLIHLIRIIERVCLRSWEWSVKNSSGTTKSLLKSRSTQTVSSLQNTALHEAGRQVPWVFRWVAQRHLSLPWEFHSFTGIEYTLILILVIDFSSGFFFSEMGLNKSFLT